MMPSIEFMSYAHQCYLDKIISEIKTLVEKIHIVFFHCFCVIINCDSNVERLDSFFSQP